MARRQGNALLLALGYQRRSGEITMTLRRKAMILIGCLFTVAILFYAAATYFPVSAVICVPTDYGDMMSEEIQRCGICATRDRAGSFNTQYFRSFSGFGIQIWLSESELFGEATKDGYYCEVEYTSFRGCKWQRAVGNPRMIGLQ